VISREKAEVGRDRRHHAENVRIHAIASSEKLGDAQGAIDRGRVRAGDEDRTSKPARRVGDSLERGACGPIEQCWGRNRDELRREQLRHHVLRWW